MNGPLGSASSLFDLSDRTVLVTGAVRGLGFAMARGFCEYGAHVVIGGRNPTTVDDAVNQLVADGADASGVVVDVTDSASVDRAVAAIEERRDSIDVLVNNAGMQHRKPVQDFSDDEWSRIVDTNLGGAFRTARRIAPAMMSRRRGKIINICSLMSEVGRATIVPYTASKGGLKMLTKALAVEFGRHNIQVNGIGPGYFATEMNEALLNDEAFDAFVRQRTPMGRWAEPKELVGAAVFLASEASDFVTGQVIYVDGGILASL